MKLSQRLETIFNMVYKCTTVADVGCDHGYLSIALVEKKVAKRAIAMDINPGPLNSAKENISAAGLSDYIETRLSDGLDELKANEAEVICICGMGGLLMSRILMDHMEVAKATRALILEPQSEYYDLRRTLVDNGFLIDAEDMVVEKNKYYPVIRAVYAPKAAAKRSYTDAQLTYGPKLIEGKSPVLLAHLQQQLNRCTQLLNKLDKENETDGARVMARHQELMTEINMISEVTDEILG